MITKGLAGLITIYDPVLCKIVGLARWIISSFTSVKIYHFPRDLNNEADAIAFASSIHPQLGLSSSSSICPHCLTNIRVPSPSLSLRSFLIPNFTHKLSSSFFSFPSPTFNGMEPPKAHPFSISSKISPPVISRPLSSFITVSPPSVIQILRSLITKDPLEFLFSSNW